MKIYTSYFRNHRNLINDKILPVGIAAHPPRWFKGPSYKSLAPRSEMLEYPAEKYDKEFRKILSLLNVAEVLKDLEVISQGNPIALLCYEADRNKCHRLMVADWIERESGVVIPEYKGVKAFNLNSENTQGFSEFPGFSEAQKRE